MLPDCRNQGDIFTVPKFEIDVSDVNSFMDELRAFHGEFGDCFQRSETKENFLRYMVGQLSDLEKKSMEPIALSVEGGSVRAVQRAVSDAIWDEKKMYYKYRSLAGEDLADPNGVMIFDETSFPKKGSDSVGVAKQYCGSLGKVDNCQVGVFSAYASPHGYALVDSRLFVPEQWFDEEHEERREKCKVPEDMEFKTKPQLAAEMLKELAQCTDLPFKYVVADSIYGESPEFIKVAEGLSGKIYLVSVAKDLRVWLKMPITRRKKYRYRGEIRERDVLEDESRKPLTVADVAAGLHDFFWYRRTVSEGTKGPITYEFTRRRVILSKDGLPGKEVWLLIRRTIGENPTYSFYTSNASRSVRLPTLVWLSGMRWAIEQCFEECKDDLGMDHYEMRKYAGWNHHILTCILAHYFLWHLKIRLEKKSASHYRLTA